MKDDLGVLPYRDKVRDFIYLDVERVKSILAQLDQGLLIDRTDSAGSSQTREGRVGVSIPALVELGGTGQYVTTNQTSETRTLHDFVYNQTERRLLELGILNVLSDDGDERALLASSALRSDIRPVDYVLIRGAATLHDFAHMRLFLEQYNELMSIVTNLSVGPRIRAAETRAEQVKLQGERDRNVREKRMDEKEVKGMLQLFRFFLGDRLAIRVVPFESLPDHRIVGPLQRPLLRDSIEDIRYKFGSSPQSKWTIFGQVASVPPREDRVDSIELEFSNQLDESMDAIFAALRGVERYFRVSYPEIAITPIAVYRD